MKKGLLTTALLTGCFMAVNAYPSQDMTVGGAPFQVIQQQNFQKMEMEDYKRFKDAQDNPVEKRFDSPEKLKQEYRIKELKSKKAKINLNRTSEEEVKKVADPANMEFVQQDGKIMLKYAE